MEQRAFEIKGYITMMTVVVVGAIGTSIAVSLMIVSLSWSQTSFATLQGARARQLAHACVEEGLQELRDSSSFTGTGSLFLDQYSCSYLVTNTGGSTRAVFATGTVDSFVYPASVTVTDVSPPISIGPWLEG